jgi:hypothetical protein
VEGLGFFSEKLMDGMAKSRLSQKMTAVRLGCSYEYVRKMVRGESLPAPMLLTRMCSIFHWNLKEVQRLLRLDDCRRKFGPSFWTVQGINPRMEPVYILFPYLTPGERQLMVDMMRAYLAARRTLAA